VALFIMFAFVGMVIILFFHLRSSHLSHMWNKNEIVFYFINVLHIT